MRTIGWMMAAIAGMVILSGCANASDDVGASDASPAPVVTPAPEPAEETPAAETPDAGKPAEETPPAPEPAPDAAPPAVEQDYYMDGSYILRPKDESDPKKVVLLTFDDGPKDEATLTSMLDALDRHGAKAIFFLNGYRAEKKPELAKLIHERGQTIGNHSWDHINLKKESQEGLEKQIDDVQALVRDIVGEAPAFFRPPFGSGGDAVKAKAKEAGMLYMTWSNGSRDWEKGYDEPQKVIDSVLEQLHPGSNILMHDLPWTAEALDGLLTALKERGYEFLDPARIDPNYSKN